MARPDLIERLSVAPQTTLLAAIQRLTEGGVGILLIVDAKGRLRGVVTDYDIRRAILDNVGFETELGSFITHTPVSVNSAVIERTIIEVIQRTGCHQIPIVDEAGRPIDVRFQSEFAHLQVTREEPIAVLMAGGLGTRLRPMTDNFPKPLLDVGGRPILFTLLDQIIGEGFRKIYVSLYYKSEMIIERIRETPRYRSCVEFIIEDEPLGTAGSLSLLPVRPEQPFLIMNADLVIEIPLDEMLQFHRRDGNSLTIALKREEFTVPYGVAEVANGRVVALREKPAISFDVNTGAYIASSAILDRLRPRTRLDMPQLVAELLAAEERVGSFPVHEYWLDVGTHENFNAAQMRRKDRVIPDQ
jgi:dTDP-glucose pyrophosphorylase